MGCFLGCFGGAKDRKRRNHGGNRASPRRQKKEVQNAQLGKEITAEQCVAEKSLSRDLRERLDPSPEQRLALESNITTDERASVSKTVNFQLPRDEKEKEGLKSSCEPTLHVGSDHHNHRNESEGVVEHLSASPKKRVMFDRNVNTKEHVSVCESIAFQTGHTANSEEENSVVPKVGPWPLNHRYHNARDSDDEAEENSNSDLDDFDEEEEDNDEYDEDVDVIADQEVWSEMIMTSSMESTTGNQSPQAANEEGKSRLVKRQLPDYEEVLAFSSKVNARDRSNYINSVLNPVENITQWKAAKSSRQNLLRLQKENLSTNFEPPRISFSSSEPTFGQLSSKKRLDQVKNTNTEVAVDASLSSWLASSPETTTPAPPKKTSLVGDLNIINSPRCFEDRPILGALTLEELRQFSAASASPRKSPCRSPDEMPIIGTVGTYWNHSNPSKKSSSSPSSFKGVPNTTSKYREDKRVNWHSTPFEKRLDRALLNQLGKLGGG